MAKERDQQTKALQKTKQATNGVIAQDKTSEIQKATGTRSNVAACRFLRHAANALVWPDSPKGKDAIVLTAAVMDEMAPQNATETMLSVQMIAAHEAALFFLGRATLPEQTREGSDANVLRATRLMRVHVHEGGQAIVGAVSATKGEGVSSYVETNTP